MKITIDIDTKPSEYSSHLKRVLFHIIKECGLKPHIYLRNEHTSMQVNDPQEWHRLCADTKAPDDIEVRLREAVRTAPV